MPRPTDRGEPFHTQPGDQNLVLVPQSRVENRTTPSEARKRARDDRSASVGSADREAYDSPDSVAGGGRRLTHVGTLLLRVFPAALGRRPGGCDGQQEMRSPGASSVRGFLWGIGSDLSQ